MVRWVLLMVVLGCAPAAQAQDGGAGLMQGLPGKTVKKLRDAPERFITEAAGLILGHGGARGIDAAGIERFIALERAGHRAREMRRLLLADLDNDGAVTGAEVAVLAAAVSAGERGRLQMGHRAADADRDGAISMAELRAHAQARALEQLSDADAELLRGFIGFDLDGDGFVSVEEVTRVAQALKQEV
ncbi:MAG TPA: hypothetical protein VGA75_13975 [Paracoccaceae bacterium]